MGEFHEVDRIELTKVKQIQHLAAGFRLVLDGHIKDYGSRQIVLEIE